MYYNTRHPLYPRWNAMLSRCLCPDDPQYRKYGGHGVHVCKEWEDFDNYVQWWEQQLCGMPFKKEYKVIRTDPRGDYCPKNCKISVDPKHVSGGNAAKVRIAYKGYDMTIGQWAEVTGLDRRTIYNRWVKTHDARYTLTTSVHSKNGIIIPKEIPEVTWASKP